MTLSPQDPQSEQDVMVVPGTDRSPSHPAPVAAPTLRDELAAAMPAAASSSQAAADDADDLIGKAPSVSGAYIYGYDSDGNPTLTEASCSYSSDRKLPT
jgi:hypothetical protein